ncbi:MAG: hypothetical protein JWO90_2630 [Solirubrobacterales bacterium]|nr:hypothetical protein [Solirubrobacterales bacterium]
MVKQAPTFLRIATMTLFALSCFGLFTFLWISFGGAVPLQPKGYRVEVSFAEAPQLGVEAEIQVAGITVGKVREKRLDPAGNRTLAVLELEPKYAPLASDARAQLRSKSLLGETYVEMTLGSPDAAPVPDGGRLENRRVGETVQLDEILDALDPVTRKAFQTWQKDLAVSLDGRGRDLNDAIGNLPGFVSAGGDLLDVLDRRRDALGGFVRNTGVVFGALTEKEEQLSALVTNSDTVFTAIQRERESFADLWQVFPTFLDESRATSRRLERFAVDTRPLVRELTPALEDLGPTLESVRDLAPDLQRLYERLGPLLRASRTSLPASRELFDGLRPLLGQLGPFLGEVNPLLDWVGQHQHTLSDVFANLGVATAARTGSATPGAPGHYLRQFGPQGTETVAIAPNRLASNRGNAYINPLSLVGQEGARKLIIASFDCKNSGGEKDNQSGTPASPACREQQPFPFAGKAGRFTQVLPESYALGPAPRP